MPDYIYIRIYLTAGFDRLFWLCYLQLQNDGWHAMGVLPWLWGICLITLSGKIAATYTWDLVQRVVNVSFHGSTHSLMALRGTFSTSFNGRASISEPVCVCALTSRPDRAGCYTAGLVNTRLDGQTFCKSWCQTWKMSVCNTFQTNSRDGSVVLVGHKNH